MKEANVFKSRKITRHDAMKLKPLTKYWSKRIMKARVSDNAIIRARWMVIGALLLAIFQFVYKWLGV